MESNTPKPSRAGLHYDSAYFENGMEKWMFNNQYHTTESESMKIYHKLSLHQCVWKSWIHFVKMDQTFNRTPVPTCHKSNCKWKHPQKENDLPSQHLKQVEVFEVVVVHDINKSPLPTMICRHETAAPPQWEAVWSHSTCWTSPRREAQVMIETGRSSHGTPQKKTWDDLQQKQRHKHSESALILSHWTLAIHIQGTCSICVGSMFYPAKGSASFPCCFLPQTLHFSGQKWTKNLTN